MNRILDILTILPRMGVCGSKPREGVRVVGEGNLQRRRNKRRARRVKKAHSPRNINRIEPSNRKDISFSNPAFQGHGDSWFDPDAVIDSDGDDEFYSVQDDVSQAGTLSNVVTPRFADNATQSNCSDSQASFNDDENAGSDEAGASHSCGFNSLLPCLACDESSDGKRKSASLGGASTRKRLSLIPSFKGKEMHEIPIISSAKAIIQRPIAGSQIICSAQEKKMPESWSMVDPGSFKIRALNYTRDKKKEFAQSCSAYVPFGADAFLSPRKISHIARFVELPQIDSRGDVPPILVVNLQIPLYPAAIFQNEYDGAGVNFVFYFKLSESYSKDLPVHFQENFKKIVANETEKIKGFPMDTNAPFRERLKILARVKNVEDLQLSGAERKLLQAYNEKPVLSRPQHEFYLGENYFEIDLDIHRFSYIARKGFESFHSRIKHCILDFGLTIQGNKVEDLPECMLCCIRMNEIDYTSYGQLSF